MILSLPYSHFKPVLWGDVSMPRVLIYLYKNLKWVVWVFFNLLHRWKGAEISLRMHREDGGRARMSTPVLSFSQYELSRHMREFRSHPIES